MYSNKFEKITKGYITKLRLVHNESLKNNFYGVEII
uniref:Uncharacterized protein n=1 Tax=Polysiphonia sp. TaxID=1967842 RepID=A0A1Z1MTC8_9FLOR|nr:hypothetical protein [Polysiphonia sp.]